MASYRRLARIAVMQTLYTIEFKKPKKTPEEILKYYIDEFAKKKIDEDYASNLLNGIIENKPDIKKVISKNAPEWPFEKIAAVDRAILEVGVFEILYVEDVPEIVAIDEAIEIAKKYGDNNSSKFINGVLNSVMKQKTKK